MALAAGSRLGPYEVVAPLGAGGMGEVYKARDTRLDRTVAVKILPPGLAADSQFRERFDREARAISQLSHPHICTLHDVGEHDGTAFLVLEMLDGEPLSARLEKGALPIDQALKIGVEMASALDAAHRTGIVHRDLKPGNVMLTKTGAKLLDFGLAKTSAPAVAASDLSMAPTTPPATMTAAGTILGTFQYMAPEQIEGMEADARTDLFALGCVLYEMVTGRKAFEGKTRASLLGAILKDEPAPVSLLQPLAPPMLDRIVSTCLQKDRDDRWQTARDLMRELKWAASESAAGATAAAGLASGSMRGLRRWVVPLATAALVGGVLAGVAVWALVRPVSAPSRAIRLQAPTGAGTPLAIDPIAPDLALSPDRRYLAYTAGTQFQLFVRALDQAEGTPLTGATNVRGPFFSPDGEWIGYFQGADLMKISVRGGLSVKVCGECAPGNRGATWGTDDTIVFSPAGGTQGLRRVPASGGTPAVLTTLDIQRLEQSHLWPEFLPGNRALLFTIPSGGAGGGLENASLVVRDLRTGDQRTLVRGAAGQPHYLPTGHLVYGFGGGLRAVAFDLARLSIIGTPLPVLDHVVTKAVGSANFSLSLDGSLAYISGDVQSRGQRLAWVDREGKEEPIPAPARVYFYLRLSPDGQRVALDIRDQQQDIWIWDLSRHVMTRLTTDPGLDQSPVWTPDGRRIAFASQRAGTANVFWQLADGTGVAERLAASPHPQIPWAFAPDGASLLVRDVDPTRGSPELNVLSMTGDRAMKRLIHTPFNEGNAEVSPDGRWLAYQSDESGRAEVHVRPFPATDAGHWQVSTDGGTRPVWARDGRELFFVEPGGRIMVVRVLAGSSFSIGTPSPTEATVFGIAGLGRGYDVSPDGRRFIVIRDQARPGDKSSPQLNVVLNWGEELKRLVPVRR